MGAGRKTETVHVHTGNSPSTGAPYGLNTSTSHRNLSKGNLGGVIFGCKNSTMKDCLSKQLFGLPYGHFAYVKNIQPGLPLFLFNYSDRKLHGIFEAASPGILNIDPYGWTDGSDRTPYPAQVQVRVRLHCQPLSEDQFKPIISDNYYTANHFWFELDHAQTSKLISLLASLAIASSSSIPQQSVRRRNISAVLPPREFREGVEKLMVMPADPENINQFSGISDYLDDFPPLGEDNQSLDSHWQMKLKDIALNQEHQDLHSEDESEDAPSLENVSLEAPNSLKEKNEEKLQSSLDYPAIIDKLIQELGELKAYSIEQTSKLSHLEEKLPMNSVRSYASVAKLNEELYVFGGGDGHSWYETVDCYSVAENTWTSKPSLNLSRGSLGGAVLNDNIFALGGGNGLDCFSEVEMLDLDIGKWIFTRSMLQKRFALAAVELNGMIYATGGYDGNSYLKYALGGFDGTAMVPSVEIFDPRLGSWIVGEPMNCSRGYSAAADLDGSIYVIGGVRADESIADTTLVADIPLLVPRHGRSSATRKVRVGEKLFPLRLARDVFCRLSFCERNSKGVKVFLTCKGSKVSIDSYLNGVAGYGSEKCTWDENYAL
ncbi:hypothetical protein CRG98_045488 [Punica granatum]|uniref:DCD domain-containing protein n=1 Tax=Punica granatum TaxID=22663 RepID=A0A2I0HRB8_PUNGR|nr:hypothetical protein CRG98_045488 [Punica granatum]